MTDLSPGFFALVSAVSGQVGSTGTAALGCVLGGEYAAGSGVGPSTQRSTEGRAWDAPLCSDPSAFSYFPKALPPPALFTFSSMAVPAIFFYLQLIKIFKSNPPVFFKACKVSRCSV